MKTIHAFSIGAVLATLMLGGCGSMAKDTAIGAAVGGVAGNIITDGSTAGTLGGAAVGGIVGHEVDKSKK
jgi:osmotically inducible lipoprotein OsmB